MSEPKRTGLLQLFLDDLESVLKGGYSSYFMGIIIYLEKTIDFSSRELSIIDGQQHF